MTALEAIAAFEALGVGGTLVYHRGFLARDRVGKPDLGAAAEIMLVLATPEGDRSRQLQPWHVTGPKGMGLGRLTQRRLDDECYEYAITKTREVSPVALAVLEDMAGRLFARPPRPPRKQRVLSQVPEPGVVPPWDEVKA